MAASYERGLQEVGDGLFAYLQPDGGWGWSNAGLVADGEQTLLIDTLFDLSLTEQMLAEMRRAVPAASRIDTLVNTHANGDHCYGNELVGGARIVASERTAAEMAELPAATMAAILQQAPKMGELGEFFLRCFGAFDFEGIEMVLPDERFSGELSLRVGSREVLLIEVGPAHTAGDTLALLPDDRVLFSGDILFNGAHPIAWAGPVSNWIAACDRILGMDLAVIVPGHGPLADQASVRELKAYFEYLYEQARTCHAAGMTSLQAARSISLDRWAEWGERERLAVNLATIYAELWEDAEPLDALAAFGQMAQMAEPGPPSA
ncbi:MAG TPA: MBL fold metallo-hydrolase [Solirubrobacteraceae bacterium]|jgi:glyoxylase-like metal-dependent hydrolase (beta-lactamase superfamily II)|nr:MBL fold metallo-hydrolase [Solirubrobacteraceae bacterium]